MLCLYAVDIYITVGDGIDGECRNAFDVKLFQNVAAVSDDRGQADVQAVGNFFVDITLDNESHHLYLAVG